jgi:N-acetyl-gamma-glutamyl-phosphate reductase
VHDVHGDLLGETDLLFTGGSPDFDQAKVVFLCVGHGEAKKFIEATKIPDHIRIIDLSQDYRLSQSGKPSMIQGMPVVYGLPELNRDAIKSAQHIANPGCFATAIQLGLLPLAKMGLVKEVYATGITGSTGAGQGLSATTHFSWRANNIQAYKTLAHQHLGEINQSLQQLQASFSTDSAEVNFVPWRGDFTRGIFITSQMKNELSGETASALFDEFYSDHPFTIVSNGPISLKQVVNTNKCLIQLEKVGSHLVVHSAIDNLVKGASGQAVQNMNLMFGIDETAGLRLKASYF